MFKNPLISFCIPTYNRAGKVFELVNTILQYEENNIEVLVLDNCSTDNTVELLKTINDSRLRILQNEKNIGGIKNPYRVMSLANGEFCFLCLDKDLVTHKYIGGLIKSLYKDVNVAFGHCTLNAENEANDVIFEKGFESIFNMAYLSSHPSGMFYKKDIFIKTNALEAILNSGKKFGFGFELINAEMSLMGKSLLVNLPAFSTESREECAKTVSYTYKNMNDVFFSPEARFNEFYTYTKHLFSLNICLKEKLLILKKLLRQGLLNATFGYREIMKDISVCEHYHLKLVNISAIELLNIYWNFAISFFKSDLPISFMNRMLLFFSVNFKLLSSIIGNKMGLNYGK